MPHIMLAGIGETMQYIVHDYNDNTIRFILRYPGAVDAAILSRAVEAVVFSVDVLHASFKPGKLRGWWKVNDALPQESYFTHIQTEDVMGAATACAVRPVLPGSLCQLHCSLVQGKEESAVVVNISHLCVDGSDGKYLLGKIAEAYELLRTSGSADGLAVKNGSRAAEQVYEQLSRKEMRQLLHSPLGGVKTTFPYPDQEMGEPRMTLQTIPAEAMAAARTRAKAEGATANDLLLAACYQSFVRLARLESGTPVSIMGMMDLRRHCKAGDSEGLSNMAGTLCTVLPQGVGEDFSHTLAQVAQQTRAAKENPMAGLEGMPLVHGAAKALPLWVLLKCVGWIYGSFSLGLTNLGSIPCDDLALGGLAPVDGAFGGPLKKKPAMQVSAASFHGNCCLCVAGQYTQEDAKQLQALLAGMAEEIAQYAANA
ncbi:MAG: hypothetical protein J6M20_01070 [Clostridia bacterium]|nr:hypothetical protein [Clostridia bacterium]